MYLADNPSPALGVRVEKANILKFYLVMNPPQVPQGNFLVDQDVAYYCDGFSSFPTKVSNDVAFAIMQSMVLLFFADDEFSLDSRVRQRRKAEASHRSLGS
jgi:hypothetical protein